MTIPGAGVPQVKQSMTSGVGCGRNRAIRIALLTLASMLLVNVGGVAAQEHHHQHRFARDVEAFHDVLAPVWHAHPGPERLQVACGKADSMLDLAKAIRSTDAHDLAVAVATFKAKCLADRESAEPALGAVHDAFHGLIERKPSSKFRPASKGE